MFYKDGHMAKSEKIQSEDGKIYDIDENGVCSNNSNSAEDKWNRKIDNFINIALNERVENTGFIENQVKKKKRKRRIGCILMDFATMEVLIMEIYQIAHHGEEEKVKYKKLYIVFIILLILCLSCGCRTNLHAKGERFIDYNDGVETLSNEEAINLVKEITAFMDTGIETGEDVEGLNGENFAYFKNKEDENTLEIYHRNYIKDSAYEYLTGMYKITGFRERMGKAKKNLNSGYIRYKLNSTGDFYILSREDNEICIEAIFNKDSSLGEGMPDTDKGQIFLTLCDDNKWRISKISQWYDDLAFYELEGYIDEFFDTQNNTKEDYEAFIKEYGYDKNGNRIGMQMLRYFPKDEILINSGSGSLEEFGNMYILRILSKLATHLAYEEIYARHGKIYPKYSIEYNYFNGLDWYKENKEFSENDLSDIEKHNLEIIKAHLEEF